MELENLDPSTRLTMRKAMAVFVILFIITDWSFFLFYELTGGVRGSVGIYLLLHVFLPIGINCSSLALATVIDKSEKISENAKNYVVTFCFFAIAAAMSIFHAYFPALWCGCGVVMMFASCYRNYNMEKILLTCCIFVTIGSAIFISFEHTENLSYYIQSCVVALIMDVVFYAISSVLQEYNYEMQRRTTDFFEKQKEYRRQLEYDNLTGVLTRPFFQAHANEMLRWARKDNPISIAIIDIDNFKHVNDSYGHENGDVVLRELGKLMNKYVNEKVIAGRYGGEEFVFAFSSGNPKEAETTLNLLREDFSHAKYDFMTESTTFSGGINTVYWVTDFEDAFVGADEALYISKNNGKNQLNKYMRK